MEKESKKPKKISSTVIGVFIIISAFAVMNFASMNVRADTWEEFEWEDGYTLSNNTTDEYPKNATFCNITMWGGDLTIEDGSTLKFNDRVTFKIINEDAGEYGIIIESGAKFEINSPSANTKILSSSTPVTLTYPFTNSGTIDFL